MPGIRVTNRGRLNKRQLRFDARIQYGGKS
jgi:hypothetical protein